MLSDNRLMKLQNLKALEQTLGSCKIYLVILPSDQERIEVFHTIQKAYPQAFVEKFSVTDLDYAAFFDSLLSIPLFGGESVVLLDECENLKKKEGETITEFLENNSLSAVLLLGSRGKTPLSKIVEKMGVVLDMGEEKPWEKEKRIGETLSLIAKKEGKWLASDAAALLVEKIGSDLPTLTQEVLKIISFIGDRKTIERTDIFRLSATSALDTPWKIAEEIIWEEGNTQFDPATFVPLIFSLRSQLQVGMKMASLLEIGTPFSEWTPFFPKMWPKILEKRREQTMRKGAAYFKRGLEALYKIEVLSRAGNVDPKALYDFFRARLNVG